MADLFIGKKFGRLLVLREADQHKGFYSYVCQCECGTEKIIAGHNLYKGLIKSCGCLKRDILLEKNSRSRGKARAGSRKNLVGKVFGDLTVVSSAGFRFVGKDNRRSYLWNCLCACGKTVERSTSTLCGRKELNCGCKTKISKHVVSKEETKYKSYKRKAESRDLEFELSFDDFYRLIHGSCFYCGVSGLIGVDRKDNDVGYTKENSVSCCKVCNLAKKEMSIQEFVDWFTRLYVNWNRNLESDQEYVK